MSCNTLLSTKSHFGFDDVVGMFEQKDSLLLGCKRDPYNIQVQEP